MFPASLDVRQNPEHLSTCNMISTFIVSRESSKIEQRTEIAMLYHLRGASPVSVPGYLRIADHISFISSRM